MSDSELLRENERIDDLEVNGFRIIQNPFYFCFGMDSVLLSNFASIKKGADVIDLGTGTGIIPLLLAAKSKGRSWTGIELQESIAEMAVRSTILNHVEDPVSSGKLMDDKLQPDDKKRLISSRLEEGRCRIVAADVRRIRELYEPASFGAVTSNPPYMKENSGIKNPSDTRYISRHEAFLSLEDVISQASYLLKTRGTFTMVHRPSRLPEIMELMRKYRLEPKRMRLVQPYIDKEPNMVLIEGIKEAGSELKTLPSLIVYNSDGSYTDELLSIYGKK